MKRSWPSCATRGRAASSSSRYSRSRCSRSGGAGRTGATSTTRSTSSRGAGSSAAFALNLVSVLFRAVSWRLTISQALPDAAARRSRTSSRRSAIGPARQRGAAGARGRARARRRPARHLPHGPGTSATLIGTVFAHRLFDLFPALLLVVYVLSTAKIPHWAVTGLIDRRPRRRRRCSPSPCVSAPHGDPSARRHRRRAPAARDGAAGPRGDEGAATGGRRDPLPDRSAG